MRSPHLEPESGREAENKHDYVNDFTDHPHPGRFRFKSKSSSLKDASREERHRHKRRRHHHRGHHRSKPTSRRNSGDDGRGEEEKHDGGPNITSTAGAGGMDPDIAFRESLFDAMADDEGAAYWEGVYGQPIHAYPRTKRAAPADMGVEAEAPLEEMTDEEYTAHVRARMWEKTHQHILEERRLREEAVRARTEEKKNARKEGERMESEKEAFERRMEESLAKGARRKGEKEWREAWGMYVRGWEAFIDGSRRRGRSGDQDQAEPAEKKEKETLAIPWPVKSGKPAEIKREEVEAFFRHAASREGAEGSLRAMLKTERVRWHPDRMSHALRGEIDAETLQRVTAVFQIVDALYASSK